ncbi:hypothetical protein D3C80_778830 [compost metagenome]
MNRACAAEGDHGVFAWIVAALHADDADGLGHVGGDDIENAVCRFQNAHAELVGERLDGCA